jgi:hypothetical protein
VCFQPSGRAGNLHTTAAVAGLETNKQLVIQPEAPSEGKNSEWIGEKNAGMPDHYRTPLCKLNAAAYSIHTAPQQETFLL